MNYTLNKQKGGNRLTHSHTFYSDEYTQRMCDLYLTDEIVRDENGKLKKFYRLHAKQNHTPEMAFAYDIYCPDCGTQLKQVGRQISFNELGLYSCPACSKR